MGRGEGGDGPRTDRWVGGIDFGYRNPFAAIWGYLTDRGVLVLEHGTGCSRGIAGAAVSGRRWLVEGLASFSGADGLTAVVRRL